MAGYWLGAGFRWISAVMLLCMRMICSNIKHIEIVSPLCFCRYRRRVSDAGFTPPGAGAASNNVVGNRVLVSDAQVSPQVCNSLTCRAWGFIAICKKLLSSPLKYRLTQLASLKLFDWQTFSDHISKDHSQKAWTNIFGISLWEVPVICHIRVTRIILYYFIPSALNK